MMRYSLSLSLILLLLLFTQSSQAELPSIPFIADVSISSTSSYDKTSNKYFYEYTVNNPSTSTASIWNLQIDITKPPSYSGAIPPGELSIPFGNKTFTFNERLVRVLPLDLPPNTTIVPVGQQVPGGWTGGIGKDGFVHFATINTDAHIIPGSIRDNLILISPAPPSIREIIILPEMDFTVDDHDEITEDLQQQANDISTQSQVKRFILGPTPVGDLGSAQHWSQIVTDIEQALILGWIKEENFKINLINAFNQARESFDAGDGTEAINRLQVVFDLLKNSSNTDLNNSAKSLIYLNSQSLVHNTPPTPIPFKPIVTMTPSSATKVIAETHEILIKVVNVAHNNDPVQRYSLIIRIEDGPHKQFWSGNTDQNGEFRISYTGTNVGTDYIVVTRMLGILPIKTKYMIASSDQSLALLEDISPYPWADAYATVTWTEGPDLVVPFFMPPELKSAPGNKVYVNELTQNVGITNASSSTTRYYISDTYPINVKNAETLGERHVTSLNVNEISNVNDLVFEIPNNLGEGEYYLAACADANNEVIETNENNNCSYSQLITSTSIIVPLEEVTNQSPDCSNAVAEPSLLWPPNHKMHSISITGVIDPEQENISFTITGIHQDESVDERGDGSFAPDGVGVGTSIAKVRAERSGLHNGRVYHINFDAMDASGGVCSGIVTVGVPHDHGRQAVPIDDGFKFDSTTY